MGRKTEGKRGQTSKNTPLLFLFMLMVPLYGGYYTFSVFGAGAALCVMIAADYAKNKRLTIHLDLETKLFAGFCVCAFVSLLFSVSAGMALSGALRSMVFLLFYCVASNYTDEERSTILDSAAYESAILSLLSTVSFFYNECSGLKDANGRVDGPFQYANSWAIFLLASMTLLLLREKRNRWDYVAIGSLLVGIFLSGSRAVWLLLFLLWGWYIFRCARNSWKTGVVSIAAITVALMGANMLSGGLIWRRLTTIGLSSSSLNGRLLYLIDGIAMLGRHPFGLGYGGYYYQQCLEQTGVYTLRSVHNEYLQSALDTGIVGGLLFAGLVVAFLLKKRFSERERVVLVLFALHAIVDFDFHFASVFFLFLLCGAGGQKEDIAIVPRSANTTILACALVFSFFSIVYYLDFAGRSDLAYQLWREDIEIAENRLQSADSVDEGETYAEEIVRKTDLSMLAWDCKYQAARKSGDTEEMLHSKYRYLCLNRYRGEVYQDMAELLQAFCEQGSDQERSECSTMAGEVMALMKEVQQTTNPLAYRIADKPDLRFIEELMPRLQSIKEKG